MRIFLQLFLVTMLMLLSSFSCDQKPNNPVSQYGDAVIGAYKNTGGKVTDSVDLDAVKRAVQAYQTTHGAYPQNLDEVKDSIGARVDLSRYDYNPENGSVSLKK